VVLADFGIAEMAELARSSLSGAVGTPGFMAPEQIRGDLVDGRADLYSLGCVLYVMLTGSPVFVEKNLADSARRHVQEPAPSVRASRPEVPAWLGQLVAGLLEKDPARRPPSAEAVVSALSGRRRRRGRLVAAVLVSSAIAAVVLVARPMVRPVTAWRPVLRELPAHEENAAAPAFSPDGKLIAYPSDRE